MVIFSASLAGTAHREGEEEGGREEGVKEGGRRKGRERGRKGGGAFTPTLAPNVL